MKDRRCTYRSSWYVHRSSSVASMGNSNKGICLGDLVAVCHRAWRYATHPPRGTGTMVKGEAAAAAAADDAFDPSIRLGNGRSFPTFAAAIDPLLPPLTVCCRCCNCCSCLVKRTAKMRPTLSEITCWDWLLAVISAKLSLGLKD